MDGHTKIAFGIVVAAFVVIGGYVFYREFARQRDIDQAQQMLTQLVSTGRASVQESQAEMERQRQAQANWNAYQWSRRRLAVDQRCVGGVVIQVRGSSYTQIGSIVRPVHCSGDYADQPLR